MTTATPTAAPTPLVDFWDSEKTRLEGEVAAKDAALTDLQKALTAAKATSDKGTAAVAEQEQADSRLRQKLATAPIGQMPQIELDIEAAAVLRLRALRVRADGTDEVAVTQAKIDLASAAKGRLAAEVTTATTALTQARADAAETKAATENLDATLVKVVADVVALDPDVAAAEARLDVLLGSPQKRADLTRHLDDVATQERSRRDALRVAADAMQITAAHDRALAALRAAADAPKRLAEAKAAVDAVRNQPDLPEQAAITAAATGADDPSDIPVPPAEPVTQQENWAIKVPKDVLTKTVAFVAARGVLAELRTVKAADLLDALVQADTALVTALAARRDAAQAQAAGAERVKAAAAEVDAHEATAADRRALAVVSGD